MDNILEVAYETIRKLIIESEWGSSVHNNELIKFLFSEVYEFVTACNTNDKDNMLEEASDVLMLLLYIDIKNSDTKTENVIEELLFRLNKKLHSRYSTFFNDDECYESEEQNWEKNKYIEKEVLNFLYCPIIKCCDYAKTNIGNILFSDGIVECRSCGYKSKSNNSNTILFKSKKRRKIIDAIDKNYVGFLKGTTFYANEFFYSNREEYLKVMRYWTTCKTARVALDNFFICKHNTTETSIEEFLMYPLRDFFQNTLQSERTIPCGIIDINDLMLNFIKSDYIEIRNRFCVNNKSYFDLWIEYIRYLLKTMILSVRYDLNNDLLLKELKVNNEAKFHSQKSYNLYIKMKNDNEVSVNLKQLNINSCEKGYMMTLDLLNCESITQIGQVIMSIVMKFNLQNVKKMKCVLSNVKENINREDLSEFIRDILPMLAYISYI